MVDALADREARMEQTLKERLARTSRGIPRRDRDIPAPLSPVQQALWLTWKLEGATSTIRPSALRLRGRLILPALEWALSEVQRRHEILRSSFPTLDGTPVQIPRDVPSIVLDVTDLTRISPGKREGEAARLATTIAEAPVDLEREIPFRAHLIRMGVEHHVLVMALDHIVLDGWSERILHHEIRSFYDAWLEGDQAARLDPPPIQYGDFAAWLPTRSSDEALEQQLAFWRAELANLPDDLELPVDRNADGAKVDDPVQLDLPSQLVADLGVLGRELQATSFMVLLAGLDILLARLSGRADLVVGVSTAGRSRPELEQLLGCFINTLPIRARVGAEATFRDVVIQAHDRLVAGLANQDLPYSRLVSEFRPWGSGDHRSLFQVGFQMRNFPEFDTPVRPELEVTSYRVQAGPMEYPLAIEAVEAGDRISISIDFDSSRFARNTIERWAEALTDILVAATADPARPVWEIPLLDPTGYRPIPELQQPTRPNAQMISPEQAADPTLERPPLLQSVAEVWAEVLDVDHVPPGAGFFELGGHSLLAIRVMARLRDRLGVDLALIELFANPTIEAFAVAVEEQLSGGIPEPTDGAVDEVTDDDLESLLAELEALSDAETAALLAELDFDVGAGG